MAAIEYSNIGFAQLFFFEHYVIAQLKEDIVLDLDTNEILITAVNAFYQGRPFAYVSNRAHAYNVSPIIYKQSSKLENLLGVCIVTKIGIASETAMFESKFYDKSFHVCEKLEDGILWALELVKNKI